MIELLTNSDVEQLVIDLNHEMRELADNGYIDPFEYRSDSYCCGIYFLKHPIWSWDNDEREDSQELRDFILNECDKIIDWIDNIKKLEK